MLNIALIGAGGLGTDHARNYSRIPGCRVALVHDARPEAAERLAEAVDADVAASLDEVLGSSIQAVSIATPTNSHAEYAVAAARAGKHVFCEKPMARRVDQARQMVEAARAAGVTLMIGHVLRFFPEYSRARDLVRSGALGKVGMVRTTRINSIPGGEKAWFADYAMSGGVTVDMVIHDFDWLLWTFGPAKRVLAKGLARHMPLLDYSLTTIRFASGAIAHVEGSWADLGRFRTSFEIAGSEGLIEHDSTRAATLTTQLRGGGPGRREVQVPSSPASESPYLLEDRHFADCVQADVAPAITPEEALAALELACAADESLRTGRVVEL